MTSKHMPEELILKILAKLPVKSLVRFKSLRKTYRNLITNKGFINTHFSNSMAKNQPNLLLFHFRNNVSITLVFYDKLSQSPIGLTPPSPYVDNLIDDIIAYGPCNGILCLQVSHLHNPDRLILWNPATREVKTLPLAHHVNIWPEEYFIETHGFGVDPMTNEYKVENLVTCVKFGMNEGIKPIAQVYSLSTNAWNIVDVVVPAYDIVDSSYTSYLNGVYHWLVKPQNDESIIWFNMGSNVFSKMNLPPVSQGDTNEVLVDSLFSIINDYVAYIKEYTFSSLLGTYVEIWIMNEYGVEESWTKRFNIVPYLEQWKFWGFWKDGEALIRRQDYEPLVSYNFNVQQPIGVVPVHVGAILHAFIYVESIIPLSVLVEEET